MDKINDRRIKIIFAVFSAIMTLLAARVGYIQLACHEELAAAAVSQYEIAIEGLDTRGTILDRDLRPLTGGTKQYYYIISRKNSDGELRGMMEKLDGRQIAKSSSAYYVYRTEKYSEEINRDLKEKYGAYVFRSQSRYSDDQTACHLIGYLNKDENTGVSGLELKYQDLLADDGNVLTVWADGAGNILKGKAPAVTSGRLAMAGSTSAKAMRAKSVITSIDRRLQRVCERALSKAVEGGAAVVLDADTGEILAWASAPVFNPNDIASYLKEDSDCLLDKVCQGTYAPGSVFKIVTAIAALESGVCDETKTFKCEGQVSIEGVTLKCAAAEEEGLAQGHGLLDMNRAMALSCNCYFAQLGELVGCEEIVKTAAKLGLGKTVLNGYPQEASGNIPPEEEVGPWDTTNISIGQGAVLVTPLQIAKMTAVVAAGGFDVEPTLKAGGYSSAKAGKRLISPSTAKKADAMLKDVMTYGTGAGSWRLPVRGKTGTAEAVFEGRDVKNCWFAGYFSVGEKEYAIAVVAERGISGAYTAMPVFKAAVDFLSKNP